MQKIEEWFNPYEQEHLNAYKHIRDTGEIPRHIVPSDVHISPISLHAMTEKLARTWIHSFEMMKRVERNS